MARPTTQDLTAAGWEVTTYPGQGALVEDVRAAYDATLARHSHIRTASVSVRHAHRLARWGLPLLGLLAIAEHVLRWVIDDEGRAVRRSLASDPQRAGERRATAEHHRETMAARAKIAALTALGAALTAFLAWTVLGLIWCLIGALVAFWAVCWVGHVTARNASTTHAPDIVTGTVVDDRSHEAIVRDAIDLTVGKSRQGEARVAKPARTIEHGWTVDVDMPPGIPAAKAVESADAIASAIGAAADALILDVGKTARRLTLTVLDRPLREQPTGPGPWLDAPRIDLWRGIELGRTALGRPVVIPGVGHATVIGAIPRVGKTAVLRVILAAAALDPRAEIHAHTLKGGRDLAPFAPVATYLGSGSAPDDLAALTRDLRAVQADMVRRYATMARLDDDQCPDGKATTALADDPALGLHPVIVALDECQIAFTDAKHGDEVATIVEDLIRRGPGVGVTVILATQKPSERSMPTDMRDNASTRIALALTAQAANDMVLGSGAYRRGITTTGLTVADVGVGRVVTEGMPDAPLARFHYLDLPTTRAIVEQAAARRGERPAPPEAAEPDGIAARLLAAWPETKHGPAACIWLTQAGDLLDLDDATLRGELDAAGIPIRNASRYSAEHKGNRTRLGIHLADLTDDLMEETA